MLRAVQGQLEVLTAVVMASRDANFFWSSPAQLFLVSNPVRTYKQFFSIRPYIQLEMGPRSVVSGKLLLILASTIILDSEFRGNHGNILQSHESGSRATLENATSISTRKFSVNLFPIADLIHYIQKYNKIYSVLLPTWK